SRLREWMTTSGPCSTTPSTGCSPAGRRSSFRTASRRFAPAIASSCFTKAVSRRPAAIASCSRKTSSIDICTILNSTNWLSKSELSDARWCLMVAQFEESGIRFKYPENWQLEREESESGWTVSVQSPDTAFLLLCLREDMPQTVEVAETALSA